VKENVKGLRKKDRGAIVVEATLSFTAFVFAIFTILSLVNIFFIQAKIGIALNSAAKEISQYSYLYYKLGADKLQAEFKEGTEESRDLADKTVDGIGAVMEVFADGEAVWGEVVDGSVESQDFEDLFNKAKQTGSDVKSLISTYGSKLEEDPKGFIIGMGKMALTELGEEGKVVLGQVLATAFMKKNLKAHPSDDADAFLKRHRVVDGLDGLDFNYTSLMAYGTTNQIQLCVTYEVSVIRLLDIDYKFKFRQVAKTSAWGNGISLIEPDTSTAVSMSVWDEPNATLRGKIIVAEERKAYDYISSKNFDAYAPAKNEFVSFTSMDPSASTYSTKSNIINNKLVPELKALINPVESLGEDITIQRRITGETVTLKSDKDTRQYRLVLVVPEETDLTLINEAINEVKTKPEYANVTIKVERKYGKKTEIKKEEASEEGES